MKRIITAVTVLAIMSLSSCIVVTPGYGHRGHYHHHHHHARGYR